MIGKGSREMCTIHLNKIYCLPSLTYGCETWTLNDQSINRVNVAWNNSFRHIFSGFCETTAILHCNITDFIFYRPKKTAVLEKIGHALCITITFWYLFHGSCKTAFMPLAACMILQQCQLQLVKLSRPFGLSLLRLFESF